MIGDPVFPFENVNTLVNTQSDNAEEEEQREEEGETFSKTCTSFYTI